MSRLAVAVAPTALERQVEAEKRTVVRYAAMVEAGNRPDAPELLKRSLDRLEDLIRKQEYARWARKAARR